MDRQNKSSGGIANVGVVECEESMETAGLRRGSKQTLERMRVERRSSGESGGRRVEQLHGRAKVEKMEGVISPFSQIVVE